MNTRTAIEQIREHAKRASLVHWDSGSLAAIEQLCDLMLVEPSVSPEREAMAKRFDRADSCRLRIPHDDGDMHHDDVIDGEDLKRLSVLIRTEGWG